MLRHPRTQHAGPHCASQRQPVDQCTRTLYGSASHRGLAGGAVLGNTLQNSTSLGSKPIPVLPRNQKRHLGRRGVSKHLGMSRGLLHAEHACSSGATSWAPVSCRKLATHSCTRPSTSYLSAALNSSITCESQQPGLQHHRAPSCDDLTGQPTGMLSTTGVWRT